MLPPGVVSFTLMWELTHPAGKAAAARNTSPEPGVPRITPAQLVEDASEAPVVETGWCAESYHDAPFIRDGLAAKVPFQNIAHC